MSSSDMEAHKANGLNSSKRAVVVGSTGAPPANQRYLVQFTVTGYAEKAAEEAPDIEAVIAGFDVTLPKAPPK